MDAKGGSRMPIIVALCVKEALMQLVDEVASVRVVIASARIDLRCQLQQSVKERVHVHHLAAGFEGEVGEHDAVIGLRDMRSSCHRDLCQLRELPLCDVGGEFDTGEFFEDLLGGLEEGVVSVRTARVAG
jgi:hypothetical protein